MQPSTSINTIWGKVEQAMKVSDRLLPECDAPIDPSPTYDRIHEIVQDFQNKATREAGKTLTITPTALPQANSDFETVARDILIQTITGLGARHGIDVIIAGQARL